MQEGINLNVLFNSLNRISSIAAKFISVPLFIYLIGAEKYGYWMVINTIPSWLAMANFGFGSIAANEIIMFVAKNDYENANKMYSTAFCALTSITLLLLLLISSIIIVAPIDYFVELISADEIFHVIIFLSLSVFLSFYYSLFTGVLRAKNKESINIKLETWLQWQDLISISICYYLFKNYLGAFVSFSLGQFISRLIHFLSYYFISTFLDKKIKLSLIFFDKLLIPKIFVNGGYFQIFTIADAIRLQGTTYLVLLLLGPIEVAVFTSVRTLINASKKFIDIINKSFWPMISIEYGANNINRIRLLHAKSIAYSTILSVILVAFFTLFGLKIYDFWIKGELEASSIYFYSGILSVLFFSIWQTTSVIQLSTNNHSFISKIYLLFSLLSVLICYVSLNYFGIDGLGIHFLFFDIVLIPFFLFNAFKLIENTPKKFINELNKQLITIKFQIKNKLIK